jgi:hypothetical protein
MRACTRILTLIGAPRTTIGDTVTTSSQLRAMMSTSEVANAGRASRLLRLVKLDREISSVA